MATVEATDGVFPEETYRATLEQTSVLRDIRLALVVIALILCVITLGGVWWAFGNLPFN